MVSRVSLVLRVKPGSQGTLELRDQQGLQVSLEMRVIQGPLALQEPMDKEAHRGHRGAKDLLEA